MRYLTAALLVLSSGSLFAQDAAIEQAVDAVSKTLVDGFNAGDAAALASAYAEDAEAIGFGGSVYKGRAAIQESFTGTLQAYNGARIQFDRTSLHVVSPDLAVVDGSWEVSGGTVEEGSPSRGFMTLIVAKQGDAWQIVSSMSKVPPGPN